MFCKTKNHEQYLRWRFCVLITNICWCFVQCSEFVYFRTNFLGCTKCIQHFEIPVMPIFNVLAGSCEVSDSRMSVFWFSNERNVCKIKLIWPFYRCQIFCFFCIISNHQPNEFITSMNTMTLTKSQIVLRA